MDRIRVDLTAVADIDPLQIGRRAAISPYRPPTTGSETALEMALRAYCATGFSGAPILRECLDFRRNPGAATSFIGSIRRAPVRPHRDWTIAAGPSLSGFAGAVVSASGGVYFWNKPPSGQIGLYGSLSFGSVTNVGVSLVGQITYYFGSAPACLAGTSLVVGVDIGGKVITGGGYLIFSTSPAELIGISFALGVGASMLPVDFTVQLSRTWITP
jgi:hypothetical protein